MRYRHSVRWHSIGTAIQIVLLDVDSVNADIAECDVGISDIPNCSGRVVYSLDSHTVCGIADNVIGDCNVDNIVECTTTNGADRKTVASVANTTGEDDVLIFINKMFYYHPDISRTYPELIAKQSS